MTYSHTFYITDGYPVPFYSTQGQLTYREEMVTTQRKADNNIIWQILHPTGGTSVDKAYDMDIFLLLHHNCNTKDIFC